MAIRLLLIILFLASCRNNGFYQPYTLNLDIPDGPPEYKAGWHAGCRDGLGMGSFGNSIVYPIADLGKGNYHHDPLFVSGFMDGLFNCAAHSSTYTQSKDVWQGPLE